MLRSSLKPLALAITTSTLIACGSGSSGGDSSPKVTGQLPTDSIESAAKVGTVALSGVTAGTASQEGLGYAFSAYAEDEDEYENDTELRRLRAQVSASLPCESSGQIQVSGSDDSATMTFVQCMDAGGDYINGSMQVQVAQNGESGIRMSTNYSDFTVTEADGDSVYLNGDFRFTIANLLSGEISMASDRFESRITDDGVTTGVILEDYTLNIVSSSETSQSLNYDFYITTDAGTYHAWTEGNVTSDDNNQGLIGTVKIEGANAILTAMLTSDAQSATADLSLDIDKDGTVDLVGEMTQAELFDEPMASAEEPLLR